METTMYEDNYNNFTRESVAQMKRKFTLDLDHGRSIKKVRASPANFNSLLTSPDLNMLKLASPELEKMVLQGGLLSTGGFMFPSQTQVTKVPTPTVSQEEFVKGFQDTLEQMHHKDTVPSVINVLSIPNSVSSSELHYTQLEVPQPQPTQQQVPVTTCDDSSTAFYATQIKEEPQTVPSVCGSPPMSPIDMEDQERIKLERKRLRNRIAASKCRKRKLEKICKLEDKVKDLKGENTELQTVLNKLRDQVCALKQDLMEHVQAGCQIPFVNQ